MLIEHPESNNTVMKDPPIVQLRYFKLRLHEKTGRSSGGMGVSCSSVRPEKCAPLPVPVCLKLDSPWIHYMVFLATKLACHCSGTTSGNVG